MNTPKSDQFMRETWPRIMQRCHARLEQGRLAYGDASFDRPVEALFEEWKQEAEDIINWGAITWARIDRLQREFLNRK